MNMASACSIGERMLDYMPDWDGVGLVLAEEGVEAEVEGEEAGVGEEELVEQEAAACSRPEHKRAGRSFVLGDIL